MNHPNLRLMCLHKRILFVDDERAIRKTLFPILEKGGFTVSVAVTVAVLPWRKARRVPLPRVDER